MNEDAEEYLGEKAARILYPLFVGQFFGIIFTAITFVVVARLLGPTSYGIYVFAFGFSTLVNGFAGFGIGAYFSNILAKFAFKREGEAMLRSITSGYIVAITVGIILTLIGIFASPYVAAIFPKVGITTLELQLASATIIFLLLNTISVSALIGLSRTGLGAIVNIMVDFLQLALSVILTIKFGVEGAIVAMLIGYAFGAILGLYFVLVAASRYIDFRFVIPPLGHLWEIFVTVSPLAWTNFLNTGMQNFSILYLGLFVSTAQLGNYGAASKGLALITMVYSALGSGLFPIFTTAKVLNTEGDLNITYNKIIRFAILIMLPIIVFVGVMSQPGLLLLVSSSFTTAPYYLALIAIGTAIGLFGGYVNNLVISEGFTKTVLKVNIISAVLQFIAMIILVPIDQVVGAIIAIFFLGNVVEAFLFADEAKKLFKIKFEYKRLFMLYFANAVFGLILWMLLFSMSSLLILHGNTIKSMVEIIVEIIFAVIIYPPVLVMLRTLNLHEIRSMRHATMKLGRMSIVFAKFFDYAEHIHLVYIGG